MQNLDAISAALAEADRNERQARIVSIIFAVIVGAAPIGLFFAAPGAPMMNIVLITLVLYNTLVLFWLKRDVGTAVQRLLKALRTLQDA